MNFIFRSPHFPYIYWQFCDRLKRNGANVFGIGDAPYDSLPDNLKGAMTEYYKVDSLEDYDQVYRAVAFFAHKYGRIDWLESNNEYWLEQDAGLRQDFNIRTGVWPDVLAQWKHKSGMKPFYEAAGVPTARCHHVTEKADALKFIESVGGYPVFCKPDVGVGAAETYKIENDDDLEAFFRDKPDVPYLMEEFVQGNIYSYDAIVDSKGDPLMESCNWFPPSIADIVYRGGDLSYYTLPDIPEQLRDYGRKTVKSFGVTSRYVHFEFFRLDNARPGLGDKGDFVGLEVNMRPAGGYSPEMVNYAHSTDVYQIFADMVMYDKRLLPESGDDHFCVYASRKDGREYVHSHDEIMARYGDRIVMAERMPDVLSGAMGNMMYTAHAYSMDEVEEFIEFIEERV